jgi:hypothetical protein
MLDTFFRQTAPASVGAARDQKRILEAGGSNEPHTRAFASEDSVIYDSGAMQENIRLFQQGLQRQPEFLGGRGDRIDHTFFKIRWSGERLANMQASAGTKDDAIGARAADIHRHKKAAYVAGRRDLVPFKRDLACGSHRRSVFQNTGSIFRHS